MNPLTTSNQGVTGLLVARAVISSYIEPRGFNHPMAIHYKPSQWRGKRLVYRSIDPDEPNFNALMLIAFLALVAVFLLAMWLS